MQQKRDPAVRLFQFCLRRMWLELAARIASPGLGFVLRSIEPRRFSITRNVSEHVLNEALFYKKNYSTDSPILQSALHCVFVAV